jgi:hypothetical protein
MGSRGFLTQSGGRCISNLRRRIDCRPEHDDLRYHVVTRTSAGPASVWPMIRAAP